MINIKTQYVVIAIISLIILGCNKEENTNNKFTYILSNTASLSIPSDASSMFRSAQYMKSGQDHTLYILSSESNIIHMYDLKTSKLKRKIRLNKEGKNGVGKVHSILVISEDSIFVTPSYNYKYYLINSKGSVLRTYDLISNKKQSDLPINNTYSSLPRGGFEAPTIKNGNYLYISGIPDVDPFQTNFCHAARPFMKYNLQSGLNSYLLNYPKIYCDKIFPLQYIGVIFRDFNSDTKKFIYSFPADENILEVDLFGEITGKHLTKSEFFDKIKPMSRRHEDPRHDYDHYIGNDSYERISYDPYRKIYYRFILHPSPNQKSDNSKMFFPVRYSIIILDKTFNKLGEVNLPDEYKYGFFYCTEDGLVLQKISKSENQYEFGLLKITRS